MTLRRLSLTAVGAVLAPAALMAQPASQANRAPDKDASQIMVTAFKSTDKGDKNNIGAQAAEEMRDRMERSFPFKQVYVIPVERINPNLIASQFPVSEALEPHDAKQLAVMLRADEYIAGAAARTPAGVRVEGDLVLTRDITFRQPLGVAEAPKLGDAVNLIVKELKEARKQLDGEKKCTNAAREKKYPEAIQFAQAAITAYPKATLARMCLVSVLNVSGASPDEVSKVARELVALDPRSNVGLKYLADAYRKSQQSDSLVGALARMIGNDPRNAQLVIDAVTEIADAKNPGIARPIIDSAVTLNPGDPDLLTLRWKILGAMKDYPAMFKTGEEILQLDTAFADTTYFQRTSGAYAADSQWQKAAGIAAQGVAKFPTNPTLVGMEIQQLQRAGQAQQALDKLRKANASKVAVPNAGTQELLLLKELNMSDQIVPIARTLIAAGDTTANVRLMIVSTASDLFNAGQKLLSADAPKAQEQLTNALGILQYADSVVTPAQKPQVAFLKGATNAFLGTIKAQAAQPLKSCPLTKEAKAHVTEAMINLPQGGASAPAATMQQLMGMAISLDTNLAQMEKAYCK